MQDTTTFRWPAVRRRARTFAKAVAAALLLCLGAELKPCRANNPLRIRDLLDLNLRASLQELSGMAAGCRSLGSRHGL